MSYASRESSKANGSPFYLYEFNTSGGTFRYTNLSKDVSILSETWLAKPISHSDVKQSDDASKNSVKIETPVEEGTISDLFLGWFPDQIVTMSIRRGHVGETETLVYWKGRVSSHKLKESVLELNCESMFTSMKKSGARARYQRTCRHALYGRGCNVDKSLFAVAGSVDNMEGNTLNAVGAELQASGWFTGGIIEFPDGSYRSIVSHSGSAITLNRPIRYLSDNLIPGTNTVDVTLYPGCDRTIATCHNKFNNLLNQGGFKWIPSNNPMGGSSIV